LNSNEVLKLFANERETFIAASILIVLLIWK